MSELKLETHRADLRVAVWTEDVGQGRGEGRRIIKFIIKEWIIITQFFHNCLSRQVRAHSDLTDFTFLFC